MPDWPLDPSTNALVPFHMAAGGSYVAPANRSSLWNSLIDSDEATLPFLDVQGALTETDSNAAFPTATLTVAASNATTQILNSADFACSGYNDDTIINEAIGSLPASGGLVLLSEGTFSISNPILFQKDTSALLGMGRSTTVIQMQGGFTGTAMVTCNRMDLGVGTTNYRPCQYIEVGNFTLDGKQVGGQSTTDGIYFSGFRSRLHDVFVHDVNGAGVRVKGASAADRGGGAASDWSCYGTELDDLKIYQCGNCGVIFDAASTDAGIGKCEIFNNAGAGINVFSVINWIGPRCYIFQNFDQSVAGGSTKGAGILLQTTTGRMAIMGNKIEQNRGGLVVVGGSGFMVTGNQFTANSNGATSPSVTQFTPAIPSGWVTLPGAADHSQSDIMFTGTGGAPTSVLIVGNVIQPNVGGAYAPDASAYAISFVSGTKVIIRHNNLEAGITGTINNAVGGGNIFAIGENLGYVTEASGTATITSAVTSVVVTHGLSATPIVQDIALTLNNLPTTAIGELYVDTIGSTTFTIHCRTAPGAATAIIGWSVQTHRFS